MSRLIIATPLYPPEIGGPATFTKIIEDALSTLGIAVVVVKFSSIRHLPPILRHIVFGAKVFWEARKGGVVLALDPLGVGLPAFFAAKFAGQPFYLRVAGDRAWEVYQNQNSKGEYQTLEDFQNTKHGFFIELRKRLEVFVVNRAKKVIVPSGFLKRVAKLWGVEETNIKVIYNSFVPIHIDKSMQQAREALGLSVSCKIILSAGRLVSWKGMGGLIDAMPEILKVFSDALLFIAGEGPERENQESRLKNQGLGKNVVFLGRLDRERLSLYVRAADVFALNSGYEGLSHQLLEVMAIGAPIITTWIGGNEELVKDGVNGLLIEYNNIEQLKGAVVKVLEDKGLADMLVLGGRERIADYSNFKMVDKFIEALSLNKSVVS